MDPKNPWSGMAGGLLGQQVLGSALDQQAMYNMAGVKPEPKPPNRAMYLNSLSAFSELEDQIDQLHKFVNTLMSDDAGYTAEPQPDCGADYQAFLVNFPETIQIAAARVQWIHSYLESILFEKEGRV